MKTKKKIFNNGQNHNKHVVKTANIRYYKNMIFRDISNKINDYILLKQEQKNVLLVNGVRQVGKTTAVRLALEKSKKRFIEVNLETNKTLCALIDKCITLTDFEQVLKREVNFTPCPDTVLFIDEANESYQLGAFIRQMKEEWPYQTVILTGSMMNRLFRNPNIRIPVGRYLQMTVHPFSFLEFVRANEKTKSKFTKYGLQDMLNNQEQIKNILKSDHNLLIELLDHYLVCGGLPEICLKYLSSGGVSEVGVDFFEYLESLKEDFIKHFSEEYANLFHRAISSVANTLGSPYKKTALIKNNNRLADNVLALLEGWKFIYKVDQKTRRPENTHNFYPKRYLFDTGLAKNKRETGLPRISSIDTLDAFQREPLGGLIEQMLCMELIRDNPDLSGYKDENYEIDFIIKTNDAFFPVECKASLKPNLHQYRALDLYQKKYKNKKAFIISFAPFLVVPRKDYSIYHIPLYAIHLLKEFI